MLTILYRTYTGENRARRPDWYSKELCLLSLVAAADVLRPTSVYIEILHDGPVTAEHGWSRRIEEIVGGRGRLTITERLGNSRSFADVIRRAAHLPPSEIVLLAEDDYLWLPESLTALCKALEQTPADYVTGYDH